MIKFRVKAKGSNFARIIQEISISAIVKINRDKCRNPDRRLQEIKQDLETVIEKYFDTCDWVEPEIEKIN